MKVQKFANSKYKPIKKGNEELFDGFFAFDKRIIWYQKNEHYLILFLDNKLKEQEEKDYLLRVKKEDKNEEMIVDS